MQMTVLNEYPPIYVNLALVRLLYNIKTQILKWINKWINNGNKWIFAEKFGVAIPSVYEIGGGGGGVWGQRILTIRWFILTLTFTFF